MSFDSRFYIGSIDCNILAGEAEIWKHTPLMDMKYLNFQEENFEKFCHNDYN